MGKTFKYLVNCVGCSGEWTEHLNAMIEESTQITARTFARHADYQPIEKSLGYGRDIGLYLLTDWHVGFYKSTFGGLPVYYFVHSSIEYIFTPGGAAPEYRGRGNVRPGARRPPRGWHRVGDNHFVRGDLRAHTHIVKQDPGGWIYQCYGPAESVPLANRGPYLSHRPAFRDARTVERIVKRSAIQPARGRGATMTLENALKAFKKLGGTIKDTTPEGIQKAYRSLALQLHPDRRPASEKTQATKEMATLNGAYAVISTAVVDKIKERAKDPGDIYKGFDWKAWAERAAQNMRESSMSGDEILRRWRPDRQAGDVALSDLNEWAAEALDRGFVRVQTRLFTPDDPRFSRRSAILGGASEFDEKGYHGVVEKTRTLRGKSPKPDKLIAAVLKAISASLAQVRKNWEGDPLDLVYKLTITPEHAAVAWTTPQSWDAAEFAQGSRRSTRWVSLSVHPRAAKSTRSKEKWDLDMVESYLQRSGLYPHRAGKWSRTGGKDFLILSRRTIKPGGSYMGSGQVYFGQLTRDELDRLIISVGGTPSAEAPKPTPPPPPVPDGKWIRVTSHGRRRNTPGMPTEWYEAVVNGHHLNASPSGYSSGWYAFPYGDGDLPSFNASPNRSRFAPNSPRQEVMDAVAAWARAQPPGDAKLLKRQKRR